MMQVTEKEWYYRNAEKERHGPYGFSEVEISYFITIARFSNTEI